MKYKDLPQERLIQKLLATSFESPSVNRDVYDWCDSLLKHIRFLENERIKLVKKYGKKDGSGGMKVHRDSLESFSKDFGKILEMEINEEVKKCPIQRDWFSDSKCQYPDDKELWITPREIGFLMNINA